MPIFLAGCATSPINKAAARGDTAAVAVLLAQGANIESGSSIDNFSPLMQAAMNGKTETVKFLLGKGADINRRDASGDTALYYAVRWGQSQTIEFLLSRSAEVRDRDVRCAAMTRQPILAQKLRAHMELSLSPPAVGSVPGGGLQQVEKARSAESDVDRASYPSAQHPHDYAVVVGIEGYQDLPAARFAERDAKAVMDHLLALGLPSRNVVDLRGDKAGFKSVEKYVEVWLPRNVHEGSRVFFYFSGHGAPDARTGQAYLLPWDGDPGFLENTGYPIKRLYEKLGSLKAKEVIVAMDACFSGAGGRSVLAKGARPLVTKVDAVAVPQNLTVFAAAAGDQITSTLEDQGHGTFTYYFLKGLSGGAKDASDRVTTKALYDYLKPKVQDAARRQNRDQEPVLHAQGDRELVRF